MAGGWLLLATDTTVGRLAWLVDSFRAGDDPLSGDGVRSLRRGVEVWGRSGVVLGAAIIPLWSSRVRAFLTAGFFQVANRLSRPIPLTADRYDGRFLLATGGVLAFTLLAHWSLTAYKDLKWFGGEDGASEWWSVATYLAAAALAAVTAWRLRGLGHPHLGLLYVLFAAVFLIGALEEVSWGQRLFGWGTPQALGDINEQHETTLHNVRNTAEVIYTAFFLGSLLALLGAIARAVLHRRGWVTTADFILPSLVMAPALLMILIWRAGQAWTPVNLPRLLMDYFDFGPQGSEVPEVLLGLCLCLYAYSNLRRAGNLRDLKARG